MKDAIYCIVCADYIHISELTKWTGDDSLHYLCPGCGSDLMDPKNVDEDEETTK